jgi:enediyne biosynthesis protein E4
LFERSNGIVNVASTRSIWFFCIAVMGLLSGGCNSRQPSAGQPASSARARENPAAVDPQSKAVPYDSVVDQKTASPAGPFRFTDILPGSGVDFVHVSGMTEVKQFPTANGSGVAVFDFDNDGKMDLCFATGNLLPIDRARAAANRLYRNTGGGRFQDVTERSGLGFRGYCHGVITGDIDNDGDQDVFLSNFGGDALFLNNGNGTFSDISRSSGLSAQETWSSSAAFLDFDNDGDLDLYVTRYGDWQWPRDDRFCGDSKRNIRRYCSPKELRPVRHALFRNNGDHTFSDVTKAAGVDRADGHGFGAVAADLDGDNRIDLYVANDQDPNFLFLNRGDGTFRDATDESGAGLNIDGRTSAGMGVDAEDLDGDGQPELFVTNFQEEYNTLFKNLQPGMFLDVTAVFGLAVDSLPWIGWGCVLADFDGDGWPDIVVANGHIDDNAQLLGQPSGYSQPPELYRNLSGKRFVLASAGAGPYFETKHVGHGLACGDLDDDGDLDIVISHKDGPPAILRNDTPQQGRWVRLKLVGTRSNRDGIGATVIVEAEGRAIHRLRKGGSSLMSSHDPRLLIGLGSSAPFARVTVKWPSGAVTRLDKVATNQTHEIREPKE